MVASTSGEAATRRALTRYAGTADGHDARDSATTKERQNVRQSHAKKAHLLGFWKVPNTFQKIPEPLGYQLDSNQVGSV